MSSEMTPRKNTIQIRPSVDYSIPLVAGFKPRSEATALPTEPQPLSNQNFFYIIHCIFLQATIEILSMESPNSHFYNSA